MRLGDSATFINGYAFKPEDWDTIGLPIIRIQNLNNPFKEYNYCNKKIDDKYLVQDGDILISWSGSIGVFEWNRGSAVLNQHIFKVSLDKINFDKNYFKYMIQSKLNIMRDNVHGATMKHITKTDFNNIEINVPNIEEQKIIANKISIIEEAIENREKQLFDTNELIDDLINNYAKKNNADEIVKLSDITEKITKGTTPTTIGYEFIESGINFIKVESIDKYGRFLKEKFAHIDNDCNTKLKRSQLEENDILFSIAGAIGRTALVSKNELPANTNQALAIIRLKKEHNPNFVKLILQSDYCQSQLLSKMQGVAQINISLQDVGNIYIPKFSYSQQVEFSNSLIEIYKMKNSTEEDIQDLKQMMDNFLNLYF